MTAAASRAKAGRLVGVFCFMIVLARVRHVIASDRLKPSGPGASRLPFEGGLGLEKKEGRSSSTELAKTAEPVRVV